MNTDVNTNEGYHQLSDKVTINTYQMTTQYNII